MADTYTTNLRLVNQTNSSNSGAWGDLVDAAFNMLEDAISDVQSITLSGASSSLTTANNSADEARAAVLDFSGTPGQTHTVTIPDVDKVYIVYNGCTDNSTITLTNGNGSTNINAGHRHLVYSKAGSGVVPVEGALTYTSNNTSANVGPILTLHRNSASPATNDILGRIVFAGEDSGSNQTSYAAIDAAIMDVTGGIEYGRFTINTMINSTLTANANFKEGLYMEGSSDPGAGKIGADTFVFDTAITGTTKETLWVPAGGMTSQATNGAASGLTESTTHDIMSRTFDFDTTTQEHVQFTYAFPKRWNAGTVTFQPVWTAASGSGTAHFMLQGITMIDSAAIDGADFGTGIVSADTLITALDVHVGPESAAITITNAADDGLTHFRVYRQVSSDTLGVDAKLLGIKLYWTGSTNTDA